MLQGRDLSDAAACCICVHLVISRWLVALPQTGCDNMHIMQTLCLSFVGVVCTVDQGHKLPPSLADHNVTGAALHCAEQAVSTLLSIADRALLIVHLLLSMSTARTRLITVKVHMTLVPAAQIMIAADLDMACQLR